MNYFDAKLHSVPLNRRRTTFLLYYSLLIMRWGFSIIGTILLTSQLLLAKDIAGQSTSSVYVGINGKNESLVAILEKISKKSGFTFAYQPQVLDRYKHISFEMGDRTVDATLQLLLSNTDLKYRQLGKNILIERKNVAPRHSENPIDGTFILLKSPEIVPYYVGNPQDTLRIIKGKVVNELNEPVIAASFSIKRMLTAKEQMSTIGLSNDNGEFEFKVPSNIHEITITCVGYKPLTLSLTAKANYDVLMARDDKALSDVVVTGMMNFNRTTFSGATSTYTGEELRAIANTNVVTALKTLEPSFLLIENNAVGSNPNVLPTINLRGTTSISSSSLQNEFSNDVNQPLFILDNFETDLRTVMDLDMNRIASITVLKDAASTAIYGSRASNGVIVIETIKPKPGKVNLSYNSDWNFEFADLSGYNMMNAAEKLEFERLSGVYVAPVGLPQYQSSYYDPLYSKHLQDVSSGVNSYWLSEPLQNSVTQKHSLYAEGGSGALLFNAGGSYKNQKGIMKGSGRDEWSGRLNLTYRSGRLSINNNLLLSGYTSSESKYGSFSTWVNTNPYYKKMSADSMYLFEFYDWISYKDNLIANPLYNANLNSFDKSKQWGLSNNLQLTYDINRQLRFQGTFQISKNVTDRDQFVSPLNTKFLDANYLKKGSYYYDQRSYFSYTGSAMLTYAQNFGKHVINANARMDVSNNENSARSFTAIGFPSSSNGNLNQAYGFQENSSPYSTKYITRRNSFISTATYTYNQRYSADLSFNYDGTTAFGKNNVYSPFYSIGTSWNAGNEDFIKSVEWISMLRLRANYGVTGNQGFTSYTSVTTYQYLDNYNYSGMGVDVQSLGNPDLKWQNTYQTSYGIDASLWDKRMTISVSGYRKLTDPLVVAVDVPVSTGVATTPFNAGKLDVKGLDGRISFAPIYHPKESITWYIGVMGSYYVSKYKGFGSLLNSLNDSLETSSSLQRYNDGYAPDDIWAVKSLGIDPATGKEIFLKKDGVTRTFNYNSSDIVKVGNSRPLVQGVISNSVNYKGFSLNLSMRYIIHQDVMNTALYNKVENISLTKVINYNQDKRALYERWRSPGDIAQFKAISLTSTTPISSRFIQQENTLSFESFSFGYDLRNTSFIRKSGIFSGLKIMGYSNDIFRFSTVKRERGTDYPFSRSFSLSLNATLK